MSAQTTVLPGVVSRKRWPLLGLLVGNGFLQVAAAVTTALLVEQAFSQLLVPGAGAPSPTRVATIGGGLLAAAAVGGWMRMRERIDAERLGQAYVHELRVMLFDRLTASAPRTLQERSQGSTMLRFIGDLSAVRKWVSLGLARLIVAVTMTVGCMTALLLLSPLLGLVVAGVLLAGGVVAAVLGSGLPKASREARKRRSRLAANVNEKVGAVAVVLAFGQVKRERSRLDKHSRRLRGAMIERARHSGRLRGLAETTAGIATAAVVVAGVGGVAPPGTVVAAMTIVGLLATPLRDLGRIQEYWHNAKISNEKLASFMARPTGLSDPTDAPELVAGEGRLELVDVTLGDALHGVTVAAEPGQRVAIVGPNGAGKSTLLSLVARLLEPEHGRILLDGQDLAQHSAADVRRRLGLVGPDLPLLRGSVERNLRYRWPDASEEELERVTKLCEVDAVLADMPDGIRTRISEGGAGLSTGQRQRVALARALLGDPPVLLLDEVDGGLDPTASAVVDRVLDVHQGTVVVVTHHRERVASSDVVWHLHDGRLVETGPPHALLSGDGPTARLFAGDAEVVS